MVCGFAYYRRRYLLQLPWGQSIPFFITLYRDCASTGAQYDNPLYLSIFTQGNIHYQTVQVPFPGSVVLPINFNNPCATQPTGICVERAIYQVVLTLPPIPGAISYLISAVAEGRTLLICNSPMTLASPLLRKFRAQIAVQVSTVVLASRITRLFYSAITINFFLTTRPLTPTAISSFIPWWRPMQARTQAIRSHYRCHHHLISRLLGSQTLMLLCLLALAHLQSFIRVRGF